LLKRIYLILLLIPLAFAAPAQQSTELAPLLKAMQLKQVMDIIRQEGLVYGRKLGDQMLQGRGGNEWASMVGDIHDPDRIWDTFVPLLEVELAGRDLGPMLAFWGSDLGQRIVRLELSARQAFMDKDIEQASRAQFRQMVQDNSPRVAMLRDFVKAGDLVEQNLSSALNASFAFSLGLVQAGAFQRDITEEDILRSTWANEAETRKDIREWLFAFLALAYRPLSDADLQAYIEYSNTKSGRILNTAQFTAYTHVFKRVSKALGLSAAKFLRGSDL